MAIKAKAKSKSPSKRRASPNAAASSADVSPERGTAEEYQRNRDVQADKRAEEHGAQRNAELADDDANAIAENDSATVELEAVPEAIINNPLSQHINLLKNAGAHGKTGRVARIEHASDGVFYHLEGADFALRVPAALARRAGEKPAQAKAEASKKAAKKKSAKKASSKKK